MQDSDADIVYSDLCRTVAADGVSVEVHIYRSRDAADWALEVVNEAGTSTVWDNLFETDHHALEAFEQVLADEGIETFFDGGDAETLH